MLTLRVSTVSETSAIGTLFMAVWTVPLDAMIAILSFRSWYLFMSPLTMALVAMFAGEKTTWMFVCSSLGRLGSMPFVVLKMTMGLQCFRVNVVMLFMSSLSVSLNGLRLSRWVLGLLTSVPQCGALNTMPQLLMMSSLRLECPVKAGSWETEA